MNELSKSLAEYRRRIEETNQVLESYGARFDRLHRRIVDSISGEKKERLSTALRSFEVKRLAASATEGTFSGYGATFNEPHDTSAWGLPSDYQDLIAPGAFTRTLAKHKSRGTLPAMVLQHDLLSPIGVWTSMREDGTGLYVEGRLALNTDKGRETYELLALGADAGTSAMGLSIGFVPVKQNIDQARKTRTITDVDLIEVSPVTVPGIPGARVNDVKSRSKS